MDFIDKKEQLADALEAFVEDEEKRAELLSLLEEYSNDSEFTSRSLFRSLLPELKEYIDDLSRKDLKQRILMIRSYLD